MKRRSFLGLALAVVLCIALPMTAYAADDQAQGPIKLTDDLAVEMAQGLANTMYTDEGLTAHDPVIFINDNGQALGYIVSFLKGDRPNGYIIFDSTDPSLISEIVVEDGVVNPFVDYNNLTRSAPVSLSSAETVVVKTDPLTYAATDITTGEGITSYGQDVVIETIPESVPPASTRTPNPSAWNDIFIYFDISKYTLEENKWVTPFIGKERTSDAIWSVCGNYACGPVALLDLAEYYDPNFPSSSWGYVFSDLYTATNSYQIGNSGYTYIYDMGPGFVSYMQGRGVNLSTWYNRNSTWDNFRSAVNNWEMSVFQCAIIDQNTGQRSGHFMSVQGYMRFRPQGVNESIYTLGVHDGWHGYARNVNLYFTRWTDTGGVFFNSL